MIRNLTSGSPTGGYFGFRSCSVAAFTEHVELLVRFYLKLSRLAVQNQKKTAQVSPGGSPLRHFLLYLTVIVNVC